jgi:hypothetical protein
MSGPGTRRRRAPLWLATVAAGAAGLVCLVGSAGAAVAPVQPSIHLDRACYVRTGPAAPQMAVTGSGFEAGELVTITDSRGTVNATITAGATGTIDATIAGPGFLLRRPGQAGDTIIASERTAAGTTLTARVHTFVSILGAGHGPTTSEPGLRALRERTTWEFSGWPVDRTIFVHYLVKGRAVARQAFGRPTAPCGVLHIVRPLFPKTPHVASYATQIDAHKHYSPHTTPRFTLLRIGLQLEFGPAGEEYLLRP